MGQARDHLAHRGEALVALGGEAHAMRVGDVVQQHDVAVAGIQGGTVYRDSACQSGRLELPFAGCLGGGEAAFERAPGCAAEPFAEELRRSAVGLENAVVAVEHEYPAGSAPMSTDSLSVSRLTWPCSAL